VTPAPLVVEVERSGLVESTHFVDVAVVGSGGEVVATAGEPATVAYLRSTAKPFQATVCIDAGWKAPDDECVAVACASHNGEPAHVAVVRRILAAAGLDESSLRCPPVHPRDVVVSEPESIFHNCSGKHAAMLATAAANSWPLDDYRSVDHPLQRAVAERLTTLAGLPATRVGVDGCGVPTFAYRLQDTARIFARLRKITPDSVRAMRAHPFLVAGTNRMCTAVLDAVPGVVIKIGAEGMFCGSLLDEGMGFALKVRDGAVRAADAAVLETLRTLGAAVPETLAPALVLGGGRPVGRLRVRGKLIGS
jgi:L-asparaginase II